MVRKTYADGTHVDYAYDADGNVLSRTSARGVVRTYAYDAAGRRVSVSYSDGTPSIAYAYDRAGRLVSVTDAAGTRTLAYDANGNCVSEGVPQIAGRTVSRTFDALNRRTGLSLGTDISATYAYDALGRVSSIASGVNTVAFDYRTHGTELAGKRWLRNGIEVASTAATYDVWGNITGISFGPAEDIRSIGYQYDTSGHRTRTDLADGTSWLYGYDRLSQVVSGERVVASTGASVDGGSFRYAYDGIGNRTSSQDGSATSTRRYTVNPLNQYTGIAATGVIPIRGRADADATVAVTATVGGQATAYRPARDGQAFSVDIPVDNSAGAVTAHVAVDAVRRDGTLDIDLHRRLSGDYTIPAATPNTPSYDADGNMLSCGGWAYAWNGEDRLASATRGTTRLEFRYDYMGRRFEKKVYQDGVLVKHLLFVYDGFKQIAEYDALANNALTNTYVWQPAGLDVPLLRNDEEFYVSDANKNIIALQDTDGQITDTYVYDPFGNRMHTGVSNNSFQFSSEFFDVETGLIYYNYRYYSPQSGKWTRRDPKEEETGANLYTICLNNCVCYTDNLGLWLGGTHKDLTRTSEIRKTLEASIEIGLKNSGMKHPTNKLIKAIADEVLEIIVDANVETDSGSTGGKQEYHYCTLYNARKEKNYKELYSKVLDNQYELWSKKLAIKDITKDECKEALKTLGTLAHMWQDYYAHGVQYDPLLESLHKGEQSTGDFSIGDNFTGSPDNPTMEPVSFGYLGFLGNHGGLFRLMNPFSRVEPGNRAKDHEARKKEAAKYTYEKFVAMFPAWADICSCFFK